MATNKKATVSTQMQNIISQMESLSSLEGTKLSFGQYHLNDEDSVKPISWYVLKDDGEYLLLISEFCIESLPMDLITEYKSDTKWSNCSLRDWLNKEFLENAFSESEKRRIKKYEYKETTIEYVRPSYKRVERSIGMCDRVFLLSAEEIKKYFKFNDQRIKGIPTEYAKKKKIGVYNPNIYSYWWTRDIDFSNAIVISPSGDSKGSLPARTFVSPSYYNSNQIGVGIRPAIWISKSENGVCDDSSGNLEIEIPCCSNGDVLYIYKGNIRCHRYQHDIIQATAILHSKTDDEIELNVEYCTDCKKFILEHTVFEQYRKRHGVLVGNFRMVINGEFDGEYDLAEESPLMLSGYNVSQKDGYTSRERHYILARIIHDGVMDKGDVIRYLSYFIHKNGAKRGNELALSKWEEDLAFVQKYDMNMQPRAIIRDIKKY